MDEHVTSIIQPNIESDTDDNTPRAHFQLPGNLIFRWIIKSKNQDFQQNVSNVVTSTYVTGAHTTL